MVVPPNQEKERWVFISPPLLILWHIGLFSSLFLLQWWDAFMFTKTEFKVAQSHSSYEPKGQENVFDKKRFILPLPTVYWHCLTQFKTFGTDWKSAKPENRLLFNFLADVCINLFIDNCFDVRGWKLFVSHGQKHHKASVASVMYLCV